MKRLTIIALLLVVSSIAEAGGDTLWSDCGGNRTTSGSYGYNNNQSGVLSTPDTQCVAVKATNPTTFGVHWRLASNTGYPDIYYGQPWSLTSTNATLPCKSPCLPPLNATYNHITTGSSPAIAVIFDCWFSSSKQITSGNKTTELIITTNDSTSGYSYSTINNMGLVTIDGANYRFYQSQTLVSWKYYNFVAVSQNNSGTVNITSFVNYLLGHGWIAQTEYLSEVTFGIEAISGQGDTRLQLSGLP